jgi:hypothetical protein
MKRIYAPLLVLSIGLMTSTQSFAQAEGSSYTTAVGVKFYPGAITLKHFTRSDRALEGLLYFWRDGFRLTGLYEIHGEFNGAPGLRWYLGPGAHVGFFNEHWSDRYPDREGGIALGIDGVIGLDYKFTGAPINISLDWQPSFNIINYAYFESGWGGLAIRYTIK